MKVCSIWSALSNLTWKRLCNTCQCGLVGTQTHPQHTVKTECETPGAASSAMSQSPEKCGIHRIWHWSMLHCCVCLEKINILEKNLIHFCTKSFMRRLMPPSWLYGKPKVDTFESVSLISVLYMVMRTFEK